MKKVGGEMGACHLTGGVERNAVEFAPAVLLSPGYNNLRGKV